MDKKVDEAISAALALAELEQRGAAGRIDEAMRDRILMAQEINRLRELNSVAPELLNALKSLVQLEADGKHADECAIETWERAAATIAKAEGR